MSTLSPDFPAGACGLYLNVELSLPIFRLALAVFIPWRGADGFDRRAGMAPALLVCWIEGGAGNFLFSVLLAAPSSYRVDRGRHLASSTFAGVLNVELSLPIFRLALAVFIPWRGAAGFDRRSGWHPRCWGVGSRAAPAIFFLVFCLAAPSSYRVDRGRHLASSTFAGVLNVELSLPIFRLRARGLYPLARGCRIRPALRMAPALLGCWIEGSAGNFRFSVLPGGAVELPGRSRPAPGVVDLRRGSSMSSSLSRFSGCRARGLYPLARGCRIRPALRMAPALLGCWIEGSAGNFRFSVLPGGAVELPGRSRPAPGVVDLRRGSSMSSSLSRFSGCRARGLYPLARGCRIRPALRMAPALLGCWIEGSAGNFRFSVLPGGAVELPGRSRPAPGVVDLRRGSSMSSSLSRFSGCRARGLYPLARGCRIRPALRMAPALLGCWIEGSAGNFRFSVLPGGAVELPGRSRPAPGVVDLRRGSSMSSSLSRFSGCRARGLYPLARGCRIRPALRMAPALLGCWIEGSAGNFRFSVLPGGAVELPGRSRPAPGVVDLRRGSSMSSSLSRFSGCRARGLYPLARGCRIRPALRMAPALLGCWIEGSAGNFRFSVLPGGAVELPGRSRPAPGVVDLRRGSSMSSSLSRFSGCRARGLYPLARGCRIRPALRMAPALLGCWIEGSAGNFRFSVLPGGAVELPGRSRPAPGVVDLRRGSSMSSSLSRFSGCRARGLYPLARGCRIRPALRMAPALLGCWIEGGAGNFRFSVLPGGAVELPGRSRPAPGVVDLRRGSSMSSSLSRFSGCRARGLYPLARGCRIRPALRMAPALLGCWIEGSAGNFRFSVLPGGAVELPGRSRPAPGVVDLRRGSSMSSSLSRFSGCRARGLYPLARGCRIRPALRMAPALLGCWIEGSAGNFRFSVLPGGAVELPGRSRPAPGVVDLRRGSSMSSSLSRFSGCRARGLYPLARGCRIRPALRMAPALLGCWIEGSAGNFRFSVLPGGAVELPGRSRPAPGVVDLRRGSSMSSSLSRFSGCRARGLYPLARGCRIRPALRMAPALLGCWIEGGAGNFRFSVLPGGAVELPGRSRPAPGVVDLRRGSSMSSSLSRFSGCRARGLYPLARGCRIRPALRMAPALLGCWIEGGAGNFRFSVLPGGAVELPGRSRPAPGVVDLRRGTQCRALSPDFPAAALAVFIPWRGAAGFDRRAGMAPALLGCWIAGGAGNFLFSVLLAAPSSYRVDRGRHLASSTFAGVLNVELSLPIFRLALAVFIPWRGAAGFDRRAGWHPRCWCVGSRAAPAFFFLALWAVELPGRSRPAPGVVDLRRGTQCRALSPDFPAGACGLYPLARG